MKQKIMTVLVTIGMLLIAVGIVMPLISLDIKDNTFRYIYASGAALLLIGRIFSPYSGDNQRLKRLYRIESWAALFFAVGAFMLFYSPNTIRDTLAFTLAGGVIQIYTSIMIPYVSAKASKSTPANTNKK